MTGETMKPLTRDQREAVHPTDNVWLSASAGTGKTQVLTARVIRLLLERDVQPENLLCITFTKAGSAEMAERINRRLASWVQAKGSAIGADLRAIGIDATPDTIHKARQLFASVLDAPGGGLQILTIHSFCQSLLASFPEEAGLVPGFKPVEGRELQELQREALSEMIIAAEARNDRPLLKGLQSLSLEMGEDAARQFLQKCAAAPEVMAEIPDDRGAIKWARAVAGLDIAFDGSADEALEAALADEVINRSDIEAIARMNDEWGKGKEDSRGCRRAAILRLWLASTPMERAAAFADLHGCWSKKDGDALTSSRGSTPLSDVYSSTAQELFNWTNALAGEYARAQYAERLASALLVGKAYAAQYARTKQAHGVVDFDDMIRRTAALLNGSNMAEWVRFKLDRRIDHILVDEAQDTNSAQWDIILALSADFYSGSGQHGELSRTVFAVGDFKQAIYGFQGTAPERYEEAGVRIEGDIGRTGKELQRLTLSQSFRSTAPVLDFVNAVVAAAGAESFGIKDDIEDHYGEKGDFGLVELLAPVTAADGAASDDGDEESWITGEKRLLAHRLARHAKALIDERPWLATQGRHLIPGDIMFLLRTRGELASLLVAQLHEQGVPVAGVDRLRLLQPLVVQDLLAAIRFVLQPDDDLSLACLLVSPIIGWDQDRLLERGYRKSGVPLWQHLRDQPDLEDELRPLHVMLAIADFTTTYSFLEKILSGSPAGRRKFAARLGPEALVPMEEMLNAALQFEQQQGGGLQAFLAWFDRGDIEIKREGESGANEVRVMTVHGAKGLQAPVVILADTTSDPNQKPDRSAELVVDEGRKTPLLPIRKTEQSGQLADIADMQKERELREHKRLLYVAMTRAEERLIMGGALGVRSKGEVPGDSWYAALRSGMETLGAGWEDDRSWGQIMRHEGSAGRTGPSGTAKTRRKEETEPAPAPAWLFAPAPQEGRPPRPLVPSRLDDDDYGDAPATPAMRAAAQRGKLIHALFERIGDAASLDAAAAWLARHAIDPAIDKAAILADVEAIVANPEWRDFFGASARAEVPLAAVVGETVISGRADRLIVEPGRIRLLDFKSGRAVPADEGAVPLPYLRQMAHYAAALEKIFPGASVEASLLFTHAPRMIALSGAVLAPHKPAS